MSSAEATKLRAIERRENELRQYWEDGKYWHHDDYKPLNPRNSRLLHLMSSLVQIYVSEGLPPTIMWDSHFDGARGLLMGCLRARDAPRLSVGVVEAALQSAQVHCMTGTFMPSDDDDDDDDDYKYDAGGDGDNATNSGVKRESDTETVDKGALWDTLHTVSCHPRNMVAITNLTKIDLPRPPPSNSPPDPPAREPSLAEDWRERQAIDLTFELEALEGELERKKVSLEALEREVKDLRGAVGRLKFLYRGATSIEIGPQFAEGLAAMIEEGNRALTKLRASRQDVSDLEKEVRAQRELVGIKRRRMSRRFPART